MKIDFDGSFKELSKLLRASAEPVAAQQQGETFTKLLSDISPEGSQGLKNTQEMAARSQLAPTAHTFESGGLEHAMASLKLRMPDMQLPQNIRQTPAEQIETPALEPEESVKTPTLLSATRIANEVSLTQMPRDERAEVVKDMLGDIGEHHGIDPLLGMAVVHAESSFNPNAVSSDGHFSKGLFQLLDTTAKNIMEREGVEGEYTPFDPEQNADLGVRYLRYLHDLFNQETELPNNMTTYAAANSSSLEKLAVAAFNAGEGRVASAQDRAARAGLDPREFENIEGYLPKTTQEYVQRVMAYKLDEEGAAIGQFGNEL